jgi:hypothetical protein
MGTAEDLEGAFPMMAYAQESPGRLAEIALLARDTYHVQFGAMSDELPRRNMEMFASEVMPHRCQ